MAKPKPDLDLTTIKAVSDWLNIDSPSDDETQNIQDCITAASIYWLWRTGNGPEAGSVPDVSPLVKPVTYDEFYDGNGSYRMFLRHTPIVSVALLKVNNVTFQLSTAVGQPGYVIDQSKKSLAIRGGGASSQSYTTNYFPGAGCNGYFAKGIQNIEVQYSAGFAVVPYDIELAARQMVAINYKRRQWIDQRSQALAQGEGTVSFRDWELPPEVTSVMLAHQRLAVV